MVGAPAKKHDVRHVQKPGAAFSRKRKMKTGIKDTRCPRFKGAWGEEKGEEMKLKVGE